MEGYLSKDSYICYEGENIAYVYTNGQESITINPQREVTPKVLYIPAERNFVSRVPNLSKYNPENDNLTSFVVDWEEAKRKVKAIKLLDTRNSYCYGDDGSDWLLTHDGAYISLRSASSGLQSLTPLLVLVEWVTRGIYKENKPFSFDDREKLRNMLAHLDSGTDNEQQKALALRLQDFLHGKLYTHTQLIIEEPEQNLYPETQHVLLQHLLSAINHRKKHRLLITTHSPYLLTAFNNAVLAGKLAEQGKGQSVKDIMGEQYDSVSPKSYAAYHINDGEAIDIKMRQAAYRLILAGHRHRQPRTRHYVELKGTDVKHGISQLSNTITLLTSNQPEVKRFAYIVCRNVPKQISTHLQTQKMHFKTKLKCMLVVKEHISPTI